MQARLHSVCDVVCDVSLSLRRRSSLIASSDGFGFDLTPLAPKQGEPFYLRGTEPGTLAQFRVRFKHLANQGEITIRGKHIALSIYHLD